MVDTTLVASCGFVFKTNSKSQIRGSKNAFAFGCGEFAPLTWCEGEIVESQRADAYPQEPKCGMADGCGHAADLAVFPFSQLQRKPAIGYGFAYADGRIAGRDGGCGIDLPRATGERLMVAEAQSVGELGKCVGGGDAFDLHPVFAAMTMARMQQALVECGFVGEQQQSFAVGIKPPDRINAWWQAKRGECQPAGAGFWRELREHTVGFVQSE